MVDLVGTCPRTFWREWIAEGDAAGDPATGAEYKWWTGHRLIHLIYPGDRFYVVAHGRLRGYAVVTRRHLSTGGHGGAIFRRGDAVAATIDQAIPGFRGLRKRWWPRELERPFPDWRQP
jgi:hypothetical protein